MFFRTLRQAVAEMRAYNSRRTSAVCTSAVNTKSKSMTLTDLRREVHVGQLGDVPEA
jgi:hypothetical protein